MRLEHLCDMELTYQGGFTLVQPYGGEEGAGFGIGEGRVSGARLAGRVRWANHPRRRSDGAMLLDAAGLILTEEGVPILFWLQGLTIPLLAGARGPRRQVLTTRFEAEAEPYRWMNHILCVAEGMVQPETLYLQLRIYACLEETRR